MALGTALAATLAGAAFAAGCRSLPKAELEERLLAISKNAPVRENGLERRPLEIELGGERLALELTFLHAPARSPDPARRPVVLVHGTPSTLFTWTEIAFGGDGFEGLRERRDVYAIEVIGHGVARGDASPYDFERCARFVAAAIRSFGLERVHLVGNSYGGEFAWRAALDAPELVASLALLDSSGYARAEGAFLSEEVQMRENSLARFGWLLNSRERIETALAPHFRTLPPGRVEEMFQICQNADNWHAMVELARDENGDRQDELRDLAAPTLLLWGAEDLAYPREAVAERFAADLPSAELVVLSDTGHYPHEERPALVLAELERFFSEREAEL